MVTMVIEKLKMLDGLILENEHFLEFRTQG